MSYTVITPPVLLPVALSDAKQHLRVDVSDDDALITATIKAAAAYVENYTGRVLVETVFAKNYTHFPCEISLKRHPVISVDSLKYLNSEGVETTLSSSEYQIFLTSDTALIKPAYDKKWPLYRCNQYDSVVVEFTSGYDDIGNIPSDLRHALLLILGHWYENRESVVIGSNLNVLEVPFAAKALMDMHKGVL